MTDAEDHIIDRSVRRYWLAVLVVSVVLTIVIALTARSVVNGWVGAGLIVAVVLGYVKWMSMEFYHSLREVRNSRERP